MRKLVFGVLVFLAAAVLLHFHGCCFDQRCEQRWRPHFRRQHAQLRRAAAPKDCVCGICCEVTGVECTLDCGCKSDTRKDDMPWMPKAGLPGCGHMACTCRGFRCIVGGLTCPYGCPGKRDPAGSGTGTTPYDGTPRLNPNSCRCAAGCGCKK